MEYTFNSDVETKEFAAKLAQKYINSKVIIALIGDLGAGKTTFTQGFAQGLNITDKIISPTFVLMRQHQIPETEKTLYHLDLYRLEGKIDIKELGLEELFQDPNALILIEWADKIAEDIPKEAIIINIQKISEQARKLTITS